jgi:hypothetical protein
MPTASVLRRFRASGVVTVEAVGALALAPDVAGSVA